MLGSGFITQAEITHLSLSQQCAVHLNTIIRHVIYRLSASKLPYFSCGRQVSSSEQHSPSEKGPNYLSTASVWQDSSWATARGADKADTWTAMTSISLGHWFKKKKKGNGDDYLRINNHVSACQQITGTFRRQGFKADTWDIPADGSCKLEIRPHREVTTKADSFTGLRTITYSMQTARFCWPSCTCLPILPQTVYNSY